MGNTSSQLAASQSQSQPQRPANNRASLPQLDGTTSSQPDDLRAKKRRKSSGDAPRPSKKPKKDRAPRDGLDDARGSGGNAVAGGAHSDGANVDQEITQKRSKKKSKKEEAQRDVRDNIVGDGQATQESFLSETIPPSTTDSMQAGKPAKSKRKRHTGRPSGFNLAPMTDSSQLQEESAQEIPTSNAFIVIESPSLSQDAPPSQQERREDRKRKARRSGQLPPELTNTQQSLPALEDATVPEIQDTQTNGASIGSQGDQRRGAGKSTAEKGSSKKRRRKEALHEDNSAILPTPPDASEDAPDTARDASPGITSDKWAAINAPSQPESSQRSTKESEEKQNRISQHEGDSEDVQPDRVIQETPDVATKKPKKRKKNTATDEVEEIPSQDVSSPPASKKRKRKSQTDGTTEGASSSKDQRPADGSEAEPVESTTKTAKKSKRARPSATDGGSEQLMTQAGADGDINSTQPHNSEEQKNGGKRSKKQTSTPKKHSSGTSGGSDKKAKATTQVVAKGAFTEAERQKVDKIFADMLQDSDMTESEFRKSLQSWRDATDFKEAVHNALPDRPAAAVRKFCQRRYHNFDRGVWSPDDDEKLKNAHAVNPGKWTEISALVGRSAADCKDRWRNAVSIEGTMQLGPWSQEEEAALVKAVNEGLNELRKANQADKNKPTDRASLEQMLSWNVVASKLGGIRSSKRCNEKWQKLKNRKAITPADRHLATGIGEGESSKKLRAIEKYYNECDVGDLFDILTEIHTAIPDHSRHFDHESTLWSTVAMKNEGSRFKSAMRRRGLFDAADVYKDQVHDGQTIPAMAKALADYLEREWGLEALREKRSFFPKPTIRKKIKSSERVGSEDEELGDDEEQGEEEEVAKSDSESSISVQEENEEDSS